MDKIPVLIPICNRLGYLIRFFKTLRETKGIKNIEFIFFDNQSHPKILKELNKFEFSKVIKKDEGEKKMSARRNILSGIYYCFKQYDAPFIIKLDPDTIHHPLWLDVILKIYNQYKDHFKIAAVSPYLRSEKNITKQVQINDCKPINLVDHVSPCAILITRQSWDFLKLPIATFPPWDWALINRSRSNGYTLITTRESYVQHIGEHGLHSHGQSHNHSINYIGPDV